ncbi:hypothetical protein ACKVV7_001937 [Pyricularia oryzae]
MTPEQRQEIYRKKAKMPRDQWLLARKEAREKEIEMYKEDQRRREKEQRMIIDDLTYWEEKEAYLAEKYENPETMNCRTLRRQEFQIGNAVTQMVTQIK